MFVINIDNQAINFTSLRPSAQSLSNGRTYTIVSELKDDKLAIRRQWTNWEIISVVALTIIGLIPGIIAAAIYAYKNRVRTYTLLFPRINSDRPCFNPNKQWETVWNPLFNQIEKNFSFLLDNNFVLGSEKGQLYLKHQKEEWKSEEALKICEDLFSLAKVCSTETENVLTIVSIYLLAAKPILLKLQKALIPEIPLWDRSCKLKSDFLNLPRLYFKKCRQKLKPLTEESAAIRLQRRFRLRCYLKNGKPINAEPNKHYTLFINENLPPIPERSNQIDKAEAEKWVLAHEEKWQPLARKFLKNLSHKSFQKFEHRLRVSVESFNQKLMSLPLNERKYIVIIPGESFNAKSNPWVAALALKYLAIPPEDIVYPNCNGYSPNFKAVIFDDAAYSGKQLQLFLYHNDALAKNLHLICPFISKTALSNLYYMGWTSSHERLFNVLEMDEFSAEELEQLKKMTGSYYAEDLTKRTLSYFDHKIPDNLSTFSDVLVWGRTLDGHHKQVRFIPETIPPYNSPWWTY